MKKLVITVCWLVVFIKIMGGEAMAFDYGDIGPPGPNDVHVGKTAIVMPLGKILLVRKDSKYCAVRFTESWTGKTEEDLYAKYESYYQGDKSGDFSKANVQLKKENLSFPTPRGVGRLAFSFGNKEIECGPIRLFWSGHGAVHFYSEGEKQGDYGIELAPTPWTDISQVNVFDPRIQWHRYDEKRERINIPIDKLWEDMEKKKGK